MADEKPTGPDYKPTTQLPAVQVPQSSIDAVLSEVRAMRTETNDRLDKIEQTVDNLLEDKQQVNVRLTGIEKRIDRIEERADASSIRARSASEVDMKHDAAIALLHTKVDKLTSIAERLELIAGNPMVRKVAYAIGGAILAYLASKGWLLK